MGEGAKVLMLSLSLAEGHQQKSLSTENMKTGLAQEREIDSAVVPNTDKVICARFSCTVQGTDAL